jgi:hypothetical protein
VIVLGPTATGLSSASGATARSASHASVCGVVSAVSSLLVLRQVPVNPTTFTFRAYVAVKKPATAQSVARALCALPVMPRGTYHCPNDIGPTYWLYFSAHRVRVAKVSLDATGCETVQGVGGTRWIAKSPNFWRVLGSAMNIASATQATFAGHLKSSG